MRAKGSATSTLKKTFLPSPITLAACGGLPYLPSPMEWAMEEGRHGQSYIVGTRAVLQVANRYRKKVLIASTSEVYGKNEKVLFREDDDRIMGPTTRSRWCYATSKAVDEFLALAYWKEKHLPSVIMRFFNTVGPRQTGQYGMVLPRLVGQALRGEPLAVYGDGTQSRCFTHVADTVRAVLLLADEPKAVGQVFNVGSSGEITILGLARRIKELLHSPSEMVFIPYDEAYEEGFEDMRRKGAGHHPDFCPDGVAAPLQPGRHDSGGGGVRQGSLHVAAAGLALVFVFLSQAVL